jgi:hypothetical protein
MRVQLRHEAASHMPARTAALPEQQALQRWQRMLAGFTALFISIVGGWPVLPWRAGCTPEDVEGVQGVQDGQGVQGGRFLANGSAGVTRRACSASPTPHLLGVGFVAPLPLTPALRATPLPRAFMGGQNICTQCPSGASGRASWSGTRLLI